jgi:hypothetical protein
MTNDKWRSERQSAIRHSAFGIVIFFVIMVWKSVIFRRHPLVIFQAGFKFRRPAPGGVLQVGDNLKFMFI